jgi:nudix-type nucleoside diphosphatase (YffH/AdpP family)
MVPMKTIATKERIRNLTEIPRFQGWARVVTLDYEFQRMSGEWQEQVREIYDRGHGAAILLYNVERRTVILVRQFRAPCYRAGDDGMLLEVPAGMLDTDDPENCIRREVAEETGYHVEAVQKVCEAYSSPGSITEKIHCFMASYDHRKRAGMGGGHFAEGEDIEVLEYPFAEAFAMIERGLVQDAKTILLLQHAALTVFRTPASSDAFE